MNDGKIIINRILSEAQSEVTAIMAEAEKEANVILKAAEEKAEKERQIAKQRAEEEARKAYAKEISGAEMAAKKALLQEKQKILDEVIMEAKKRLENLDDVTYQKVIGDMLEQLDKSQGTEVIVSERDKKRLADVIKEKGFTLSAQTRELDGGFVVKHGDIEYNYSFEAIITVQKEEMQITAANILF